MLSTLLLVPLSAILSVNILGHPQIIVPLVAISLFVGGLLRIIYALMMEDAVPQEDFEPMGGYAPPAGPQFGRPAHNAALPPAAVNATPGWRAHPNTAEIYQPPPSITENTTRLLDKEDPKNR
jgi:hypothetical protein